MKDELVKREGIYYQKFSNVPFSGKTKETHHAVTGELTLISYETFENGLQEGPHLGYFPNGQLAFEGRFRAGKDHGPARFYHYNGQLESYGEYKNGVTIGQWTSYHEDGSLWQKSYYRNGELHGPFLEYWFGGDRLWNKGKYKDGKRVGAWVGFHSDGTVDRDLTGTFKNGIKISD